MTRDTGKFLSRAQAWAGTETPVLVAGALALGAAAATAVWWWGAAGALPDTATSGVWCTLADDVAHGKFYRPVVSELGYGGTRYMPLFFLLHGGLVALGCDVVRAGAALTLGAAAGVVVALAGVLRELGGARRMAWGAAALVSGTVTWQMAVLSVRGDFLALALNLAGVAAALAWARCGGGGRLALAVIFFAAAWMTKITTVTGVVAVAGWLAWGGRRREAAVLAGAVAALALGLAVVANAASGGRMGENFFAVAGGGTDGAFAMSAPWRLLWEGGRDPLGALLVAVAAGCAWGLRRGLAESLAGWLAAATVAVALVIFASPGTGANHLLEVHAAAVVVIAVGWMRRAEWRGWLGIFGVALAAGQVAPLLPGVPSVPKFFAVHARPTAGAVREFLADAGPAAHPMLAENPLVPLLAGERPAVADWFNFELWLRRDPARRAAALADIRAGKFGSVALPNWPVVFSRDAVTADDPLLAGAWPALRAAGVAEAELMDAIGVRYRVVRVRRPFVFLWPRERAWPVAERR